MKQILDFLVGSDWRFDIDAIDHWSRGDTKRAVSDWSEPKPLDVSEIKLPQMPQMSDSAAMALSRPA